MFKLFGRLIYTAAVLVQALILTRFVALALNASKTNPLIKWVIDSSNTFVQPFIGILDNEFLKVAGFSLELTSVVAFFFFLIIGFISIEIVKAFSID
jgi:hypothetical protein